MPRSTCQKRKRNKQAKARKAYHARKRQSLATNVAVATGLPSSEQQSVSDGFTVNNLLEELPQPEMIPVSDEILQSFVKTEILNELEPVAPSELPPKVEPAVAVQRKRRVPRIERSAFCELCLRKWPPEQAVSFSSSPRWDSLDPSQGQRKVHRCVGIKVELDGRSICTSCWKMVEMWEDFRKSCLKARGWMARYGYGLDQVDGEDNWITEETVESLDTTHSMVRSHIDRMKARKESVDNSQLEEDETEELDLAFEAQDVKLELVDAKLGTAEETSEDPAEPAADLDNAAITEPIEIQVFTCAKCSMKFDRRHSYSLHVNRCKDKETNPNLLVCPICGVNFKQKAKLNFHMNRHRGIKPYSCRVKCDASFYSYFVRCNHERRCGADPLVCTTCGVLKKTPNELEEHMTSHAAEATIPCETCGKLFRSMRAQRKHQRVHSSERNYPCDVCGKRLKSSTALRVHRRIHTQEKPYSCTICGQGFTYKCLIKPHVAKCHLAGSQETEEN
uniref:C2H2-type domain-containing protein n=1 Tax=Culex tarsalis TaxID=7177 RepID=A0A1Q3F3M2_CULTA